MSTIPSLTVLLTTMGRPSLKLMLDSLVSQLQSIDYLYIIIDGPEVAVDAKHIIKDYTFQCKLIVIVHSKNLGYWGHGLRNKYQSKLKGDYILHADDDDQYVPQALDIVRTTILSNPSLKPYLYIFKMKLKSGKIIPADPITDKTIKSVFRINNIGTPNGVVPNQPKKFGTWSLKRGGDYNFWDQTAQNFEIYYSDHVIYHVC